MSASLSPHSLSDANADSRLDIVRFNGPYGSAEAEDTGVEAAFDSSGENDTSGEGSVGSAGVDV